MTKEGTEATCESTRPRDASATPSSTPLLAILAGAVIMVAATWWGAQQLGNRLVADYIERESTQWASRATDLLEYKDLSFATAAISARDKVELSRLIQNSSVYRHVLFDKQGKVFASSYQPKVGTMEDGPYFRTVVAKGGSYVKHVVKKAGEIDGLINSKAGADISPDAPRHVSEIYVPVMSNGHFVGAIELYIDVTDISAWFNGIVRYSALFLCAGILATFIAIAAIVSAYGRERNRVAQKLTEARDQAISSALETEQMSEQLRTVNADVGKLNRELEQNISALRDTQDELVRRGKLAQLGQLTATVAHEIRNPLGAIRTSAFLIERKIKGSELDLEKPLSRINNGIVRCDEIITELLDFARSKAVQAEPVILDDWVASIVREQSERLPVVVGIECRLATGGREVSFDRSQMERVLINLLSNASEAMVGKGDDPASFASPNPKMTISTRITARGVEIAVADIGPGMDEETRAKVLEPLYTTKSFGVGLGLPAVENILREHGGGLDIESEPGRGACFTAWFPMREQIEEAA